MFARFVGTQPIMATEGATSRIFNVSDGSSSLAPQLLGFLWFKRHEGRTRRIKECLLAAFVQAPDNELVWSSKAWVGGERRNCCKAGHDWYFPAGRVALLQRSPRIYFWHQLNPVECPNPTGEATAEETHRVGVSRARWQDLRQTCH